MRMIDLQCSLCGHTKIDHLQRDVDARPPFNCPKCEAVGTFEKVLLQNSLGGVKDDSIPGGFWAKNGICNPDGTPKRYDSWTDVKKAADAAGVVNRVRHLGRPGSDKSPHTTKWS